MLFYFILFAYLENAEFEKWPSALHMKTQPLISQLCFHTWGLIQKCLKILCYLFYPVSSNDMAKNNPQSHTWDIYLFSVFGKVCTIFEGFLTLHETINDMWSCVLFPVLHRQWWLPLVWCQGTQWHTHQWPTIRLCSLARGWHHSTSYSLPLHLWVNSPHLKHHLGSLLLPFSL